MTEADVLIALTEQRHLDDFTITHVKIGGFVVLVIESWRCKPAEEEE